MRRAQEERRAAEAKAAADVAAAAAAVAEQRQVAQERRAVEALRLAKQHQPSGSVPHTARRDDAGWVIVPLDPSVSDAGGQSQPQTVSPSQATSERSPRSAPNPTARRKATRSANKNKPVQDEWGLFDPDQCGFAALVEKLDHVTRDPKKEEVKVRVITY